MLEFTRPRVLIAGLGNVFFGDDAFGVEVVRRLAARELPSDVRVLDVGIRSLHLAYEVAAGGFESVILIDVVSRGQPPGTLYVIEPEAMAGNVVADAHGARPDELRGLVRSLGGRVERMLLVACEPAVIEESMVLSDVVAAAVEGAAEVALRLATEPSPAIHD